MGKLLKTYCTPHPPIIIPEIGQGSHSRCQGTYHAMQQMAKEIVQLAPKRLVIISPHGTVFSDGMGILYTPTLHGDLSSFGYDQIALTFKNDIGFVDQLVQASDKQGVVLARIDEGFAADMGIPYALDHGALVPLWFIQEALNQQTDQRPMEVVHFAYGLLSTPTLYQFGHTLRQVIKGAAGDTIIIASGDLSHTLGDLGPYTFDPHGADFDQATVNAFRTADPYPLLTYNGTKRECAKECGFRSLAIAFGAYDRLMIETQVLSYEGPFGVGYLVASMHEIDGIQPSLLPRLRAHYEALHQAKLDAEDDYVQLARHVVNTFVLSQEVPEVDRSLYEIDDAPHGCFVSIKSEAGLRGCIGTIIPTRSSLVDEIVDNAVKACSEDPRFDPIQEDELVDLHISVDVLLPPEPIASERDLDPKRYGVIVTAGLKKGLLLPNLEGIDSVFDQLRIAKSKAGIQDEPYRLERFEVIRHEGIVEDFQFDA